jgi:excisionase family DNA binding protein
VRYTPWWLGVGPGHKMLEVPAVEQSLTVSIPEAANLVGISPNHAWRLVQTGELPSIRLGRRVLVPRSALVDLVERATARRPAPAA